jgi:uroporphyrin-III C-methyltransferase/precorrin-2 dehydrogenase/sirohydrochlorin ferrochelatase
VVRLKGGDPMIFGRAGEEIAACRAANIPVEVVPGISAAQGAAARLKVPLTHRADARRVQFVTGHGSNGRLPADIDWHALADPKSTTIVYMPKKTLRELTERAIASGLNSSTPAVVITNVSRPDETTTVGEIGDIADKVEAARLPGPALVMIGQVLAGLIPARNHEAESFEARRATR